MSERDDFISPISTFLDSLRIFLRNKQIFISIFALTTLPLSFLLFSLSLSSRPLQSQIYRLERLANLSSTRFEARHVWKESRADALSLLRLKAAFFLPCYALSLLAVITAVNSAAISYRGKRPTLQTAITAVKLTWKRPLVTAIFTYALMLSYALVPRTLAALVNSPALRLVVLVIGSGLEIYIMAALSLALVVSVEEEKFGWDAVRVGSGLMEGRRLSGWVLSGLFVLVRGIIGWEFGGLMDGEDLSKDAWTVMMGVLGLWDKVGLICLYGMVVLWSYIVTTVYYCECRKRHVVRDEENEMVDL